MDEFEEYQKEEYGRIAEAHFKTLDAISSFFRYYLIVMALPLTVLGVFVSLSVRNADPVATLTAFLSKSRPGLGIAFFVIALIGMGIMAYVVNLRLDAILYARTVNSVRKFFYDKSDVGFMQKLRMRVLPQTAFQPSYREIQFYPVVFVFALFNTFYVGLAFAFVLGESAGLLPGNGFVEFPVEVWVSIFVFFALHIVIYGRLARFRENGYLQRGAIGVDIDGVLNLHRKQFAAFLYDKCKKRIDPGAITSLPVHRTEGLGVDRDDELKVFNDPKYWITMPPDPDAARYVGALRDAGLRVHIVTNRPWPSIAQKADRERRWVEELWLQEAQKILSRKAFVLNLIGTWLITTRVKRAIELITKTWLEEHRIPFDSLLVEDGGGRAGVHAGFSRKNRFALANEQNLRFFVEDDWESAFRLAFVCDVVFLMAQPYNRSLNEEPDPFGKRLFTENLPENVVVVESWRQVYELIRRLR